MAYGPGESRFVEEKRHYEKPIPISDLVYLDRERCILCDRCTRFAEEVAGDPLIHFIDRGNETAGQHLPRRAVRLVLLRQHRADLPGRRAHGQALPLQGPPVGPRAGRVDLHACSVGCRVAVQSSRNQVLRYLGVDIDPVNWGWLCDKGRFGFEAINSDDRLGDAAASAEGDELVEASWAEALERGRDGDPRGARPPAARVGRRPRRRPPHQRGRVRLGQAGQGRVIGTDNVDAQLGDGLPADARARPARRDDRRGVRRPAPSSSLGARPQGGAAGPVPAPAPRRGRETASVIELVTARHRPHAATRPRRCATGRASSRARRGTARRRAPTATGGVDRRLARAVAPTSSPIVGRPSVAESAADRRRGGVVAIVAGPPDARFLPALRRGNVHGALDMGLAPGCCPAGSRSTTAATWFAERVGDGARRAGPRRRRHPARRGRRPHRRASCCSAPTRSPTSPTATSPSGRSPARARLIAVDMFLTESLAQADVVLRGRGLRRGDGTTTNLEGRVSPLGQKVTPPGTARPDWMIAAELPPRCSAPTSASSRVEDDLGRDRSRTSPPHTPAMTRRTGCRQRSRATMASSPVATVPTDAASSCASPAGERSPTAAAAARRLLAAPGRRPRKLYDHGDAAALAAPGRPRRRGRRCTCNPSDLDRLGVAAGGKVKVTVGRATTLARRRGAPTPACPRGTVALGVQPDRRSPCRRPHRRDRRRSPTCGSRRRDALLVAARVGDPLLNGDVDLAVVAHRPAQGRHRLRRSCSSP